MKRKITLSFLGVIILSTLLILLLSFLSLYFFIFSKENVTSDHPPNISLSFSLYIEKKDNNVTISQEGQQLLKDKNAWIQVLDSNGEEIYQIDKPEGTPAHYTPAEIVHAHMYPNTINGYTLFVASSIPNDDLSYIIGFPSTEINKFTFNYNSKSIVQFIIMVLSISFVVLLITGFIFGSRLTNPIVQIIEGVEFLSEEKYWIQYKEKGIYKKVFVSLNKLAENLKKSMRERKRTEKLREEWISNISHDLKTPLSSIKGYSEVLSDPDYNISEEEIKTYSKIIFKKSNYMEDMIEELRLNEKLKHNALSLNKAKHNLTKFLREIVVEILNHPNYTDRVIHFYSEFETIEFSFDKSLMKRCIENLIYNAIVHNNKDTEIFINLYYKKEKIIIEIKDNGKGINKEDLENLFIRYYRGTNTEDHKGSGLGMSIAKEVIAAHDGQITVDSRLNKGTIIRIIL